MMIIEKHQLVLRYPESFIEEVDHLTQALGLTRADLFRTAIILFLDQPEISDYQDPIFESPSNQRINIYLTDVLHNIVRRQANQLGTSANLVTAFAVQKLKKRYAQLLEESAN